MVINHIGEVVRRIPIRFDDNEVLLRILLLKLPIYGILHLQNPERVALEPHNVSLSLLRALRRLLLRDGAARLGVNGRLASLVLPQPFLLEDGRVAEAAVGVALLDELVDMVLVEREALGLLVGAVRAAAVWAFVPGEAEPFEVSDDGVFRALYEPVLWQWLAGLSLARGLNSPLPGLCPRYAG